MSVHPAWAGILREGETILWQGRPAPGLHVDRSRRHTFWMSIPFILVSLGLLVGGIVMIFETVLLLLFALFFGAISLMIFGQTTFWRMWVRRHTQYTLTDQRAILGISLPWMRRRLKTFDLTRDVAFEPGQNGLGSIIFEHEDQGVEINDVPQYYAVGFMHIADADVVWQKVQGALERQTSAAPRTRNETEAGAR